MSSAVDCLRRAALSQTQGASSQRAKGAGHASYDPKSGESEFVLQRS